MSRAAKVEAAAGDVMSLLSKHGASIVPHLLDTDDNAGERLRAALALPDDLPATALVVNGEPIAPGTTFTIGDKAYRVEPVDAPRDDTRPVAWNVESVKSEIGRRLRSMPLGFSEGVAVPVSVLVDILNASPPAAIDAESVREECERAVKNCDCLPAVNEVWSLKSDDPIRALDTVTWDRVVRVVCAAVEVQRRNDAAAIRSLNTKGGSDARQG